MTLSEYQTIIEKTAVYPKEIGLAYCALGLAGEAGETAEKIKKLYRDHPHILEDIKHYDNYQYLHKDTYPYLLSIAKEISDVLWYCTALAKEMNFSLEDILELNYDKLMKRKETNTLHGEGDNRENG